MHRVHLQEWYRDKSVNEALLERAFAKYGPIPRTIFEAYRRGGAIIDDDRQLGPAINEVTYLKLKRIIDLAKADIVDYDFGKNYCFIARQRE